MLLADFESVTVIMKFQAKFVCFAAQSRFKIARVRVLERVSQGFLSDVQEILLPNGREIAQLAPKLEGRVKRGSRSCVLDNSF